MEQPDAVKHPRRYTCPQCQQPIERAQPVVFDGGELVHHSCFVQSGGAIDLVEEFVQSRRPAAFCHSCLRASLRITYEDVQKAVATLRLTPDFRVLIGQECALCAHSRVTLEAVE